MAALPLPVCYHGGNITKTSMMISSVPRVFQLATGRNPVDFRSHDPIGCSVVRSSMGQLQPRVGVKIGVKEEKKKEFCYTFRSDNGGIVKVVVVGAKNEKYTAQIEVSCLPQMGTEDGLVLCWGMFRSDSSQLLVPDFVKVPFLENVLGFYAVELEFNASQAPFYLSFLLTADGSEIRTHRNSNFCVPIGISSGHPMPFGVSISDDGMTNFSLYSRNAESVILCLYDGAAIEPAMEIELDPYVNRTGDIWHVSMESVEDYVSYGYRCRGPMLWKKGDRFHMRQVLLDPYAKVVGDFVPDQGGKVSPAKCLAPLRKEPKFDWSNDSHPRLPMEKLVVYRLNVELFTKHKSSELLDDVAGTFRGLIEKIEHFRTLGINAILLEPVFPFDELKGPYFPYHFFSPMNSYGRGHDGISSINSMKEMIKVMHAHGIEVFLEVVFTHTSEGGDAASQMISFRGIDNSSYYVVDGELGSGTNNSLSCNTPIVQQLILDSLHYWAVEFHVDGFCFVNSSFLIRGSNGNNLSRPPLVESIALDPILSRTKIISDCWSPLDMSYMEIQFPHWKRWAEMNTRFCTDVRNFLRGETLLSDIATRLCGSGDLFSSRGPAFSFNYIAKNFGLPLVDLVSFSSSELASELSWNCGKEGTTNDISVLETRLKQIRNFLFVLFISLGPPVLNMGDECGYSTGGSPSYSDREPIDWNGLRTAYGMQVTQFVAYLSSLRTRRGDIFQRKDFLKVENISWHGTDQSEPNWVDPSCKFISMALKAAMGDLFLSFNASDHSESVTLPEQPEGSVWLRLVDTALPFPGFFASDSDSPVHEAAGLLSYEIKAHSCALFEAKRSTI
ncbi:isoamylase 2, chloroplastic [Typha angustifolia]|uniref:isoamylase 2, chloroplastic n=1 Tax=Typha angustifolia TaxID=59011 RepID=UPI003C2E1266